MALVVENLRLAELVAIVNANRLVFDEFGQWLGRRGFSDVHALIQCEDDERAYLTIHAYLADAGPITLYDGVFRPYKGAQARWYFLAWLLRDAPAQRLAPLLKEAPGANLIERRARILNTVRRHVRDLLPDPDQWRWPAVSEVMLARLEGSRRALKGTLFEGLVREELRRVFAESGDEDVASLEVGAAEVRLANETYDVTVSGNCGTILLPVKTRETMGGGHAHLFMRDIHKSITAAEASGYTCIPVIIAESWVVDFSQLPSAQYVYVPHNPNQLETVVPLLRVELEKLLPTFHGLVG
jgi:hypothetical protein